MAICNTLINGLDKSYLNKNKRQTMITEEQKIILMKVTKAFELAPSIKENSYLLTFKTKVKWLTGPENTNGFIRMGYVNEHGRFMNGWATTITESEIVKLVRDQKIKKLGI